MKMQKTITELLLKELKAANVENGNIAAITKALTKWCPEGTHSEANGIFDDSVLRFPNFNVVFEGKDKFSHGKNGEVLVGNAVVQGLKYVHELIKRGIEVSQIFVADNENYYIASQEDVVKCLSYKDKNGHSIDFSLSGRAFAAEYPDLVAEINKEVQSKIRSFWSKDFDITNLVDEMEKNSKNEVYLTRTTRKTMHSGYDELKSGVLSEKIGEDSAYDEEGNIYSIFDLYMTGITVPELCFPDKEKANVIWAKSKKYRINSGIFKKFQENNKDMPALIRKELISNKDLLFNEEIRRYFGSYYTPFPVAKYFQKKGDNVCLRELKINMNEEYRPWDASAGTGNLTADCKFKKQLCLTTLEPGDVETIKESGYNSNAEVSQYDFLSEIYTGLLADKGKTGLEGAPESIQKAFENNEPIQFINNPPGGAATSYNKKSKKGIANNPVNKEMLRRGMGQGSNELASQYVAKMLALKEAYPGTLQIIRLYIDARFLTVPKFRKIRNWLNEKCILLYGGLFSAKQFSNVNEDWGMAYLIYVYKSDYPELQSQKFLTVLDFSSGDENPKEIGKIEIYDAGDNLCVKWVKKDIKSLVKFDAPGLRGAIYRKQEDYGKAVSGAWGYVIDGHYDSVAGNAFTYILSAPYPGHGFPITDVNIASVTSWFEARKLIERDYTNSHLDYLKPDIEHLEYKQWENDAFYLSTFSNQSALRDVIWKGKFCNILNEFFTVSYLKMKQLAKDSNFEDMLKDLEKFNFDRKAYTYLQNIQLSPNIQKVKEMYEEMLELSMLNKARENYYKENSESNLHAWDAGWAQLRPMFKKHLPVKYKEFMEALKLVENRMKDLVYKFGFLKKMETV